MLEEAEDEDEEEDELWDRREKDEEVEVLEISWMW